MIAKRKPNPIDDILRQSIDSKQDDADTKIHSVIHKGKETQMMEKNYDIVMVEDSFGVPMPKVVANIKYHLTDDGRSMSGTRKLAGCDMGCIVRVDSIRICSHCRKGVCRPHSLRAGKRYYCRRKPCIVYARIYQVVRCIYRLIRFVVLSVIGAEIQKDAVEEPVYLSPDEDQVFQERQ